ncbi:hypothetical protein ACA910_022094 [Epithemia clementina (nom. ined.)]
MMRTTVIIVAACAIAWIRETRAFAPSFRPCPFVATTFVAQQPRSNNHCVRLPTTTTTTTNDVNQATTTTSLNAFFFGKEREDKKSIKAKPKAEPVIIEPDFRVALLFLSVGGLLDLLFGFSFLLGPLVTLLGCFFLFITFRFRFVFDETSFSLAQVKSSGGGGDGDLDAPGENIIVGGENRWATSSIFNYDFFPQDWMDGPTGPILVYFKEDQTPKESWNEGPGKFANDPAKIEAGIARPGQVHFFPAIANTQQLREEFAKRGCKKI